MFAAWALERLFVPRERARGASRSPRTSKPTRDAAASLLQAFDADWYRSQNPDVDGTPADLLSHYQSFGSREGRRPCRDFDPLFYAKKYASQLASREPFAHFIEAGSAMGFSPNLQAHVRSTLAGAMDHGFYTRENPDVADSGLDVVDHYIALGALEGRNPHPAFDTLFYLLSNDDVREEGVNPYFHYIEYGRHEGRQPSAAAAGLVDTFVARASATAALERASARRVAALAARFDRLYAGRDWTAARDILFEDEWYSAVYHLGEEERTLGALDHYRTRGAARGNWPHPLFDVDYYRAECRKAGIDVGEDVLLHYTEVGARASLSPHRLFDCKWYASELERVGRKREDASLTDYMIHGWSADLDPHPLFSTAFYKKHVDMEMPGLLHYALVGWSQRHSPHPLFDVAFYLQHHPAALQAFQKGVDPLVHYMSEGTATDMRPHRDFDPKWYKTLACPPHWTRSPLEYLCLQGLRISVRLSDVCEFDMQSMTARPAKREYRDDRCPFVSLIIVNMNGDRHLEELFRSLDQQTYTNFEVIFVDNASSDASRETLARLAPSAKLIALDRNAGFAEANNIGLERCSGDLIALLNNDARADPNWLGELVAAFARHPQAGAVTSRVRFWTKFSSVRLTSTMPFSLNHAALNVSLRYAKIIVSVGAMANGKVEAADTPDGFVVELKLPSDETTAVLECHPSSNATIWFASGRVRERLPMAGEGCFKTRLDLSTLDQYDAHFVINNAGSYEPSWLTTADLGFGDFDLGQHGQEREVALACGCAMIVRRSALLSYPLFVPDFIAYFEDSELSRRLRKTGHTIVYAPGAIVYHKHSSTSTERSAFWHKQVRRNGILYKYMEMPLSERHAYLNEQVMELNHYHKWILAQGERCTVEEKTLRGVLPEVISDVTHLCRKVDHGSMLSRCTVTRIGIYNRYWNTRGGGEAHALFVAAYLARFDIVELMSDLDFDLVTLGSYFNVDVSRFRKRLLPSTLTEAVTAEYDVFVNSTYMDETPSAAKHSFFIVSFPSKDPSEAFKRSYVFLTNSGYTRRWTERLWGAKLARMSMLEPVVAKALVSPRTAKRKVILSVGRFFRDGHSKNQLQIVRAFKALEPRGWTLKLAGSVGHQSYFDEVEAEAAGARIELFPDTSLACLRDLYAESAIYVHASGLGQSQDEKPENFEHFGMTVAEACANGCFPIVFDCAGPSEIIGQLGFGSTFGSEETLISALGEAVANEGSPCRAEAIRAAASIFLEDRRHGELENIFSDALPKPTRGGQNALEGATTGLRVHRPETEQHHVFAFWNGADQSRIIPFKEQWQEAFPFFRLYEDEQVIDMIAKVFPEYVEVYRDIRIPAAKSDIARCVLLYLFGGLYVDVHCGIDDVDRTRRLLFMPDGRDVVLIDRAEAEGPRYEGEHIFQSSVMLARPSAALIYAIARQGLANLAAVRDYEQRFGRTTYHIGALSGPGLITGLLKVPYSPTHEIKPEFRETLHILPEEECPIVRNRFSAYRPENSHWYHRQQVELLFERR